MGGYRRAVIGPLTGPWDAYVFTYLFSNGSSQGMLEYTSQEDDPCWCPMGGQQA